MPHFPFQRLQADLAALIARLPAGSKLPSEPDLAAEMGVSRATLREAMRTFEAQGLIRRRQGAGTYVLGQVPLLETGLEVLESLQTIARRSNLQVTVSDTQIVELPADAEHAQALNVAQGDTMVRVARVMRADTRPVAYLIDTLPHDIIVLDEFKGKFGGSVLDYFIQRGDPLTISKSSVTAVAASADLAKRLEIQRNDPLLSFVASLYTASGRVVDYSYSYFLPGYFKFHVVRKI